MFQRWLFVTSELVTVHHQSQYYSPETHGQLMQPVQFLEKTLDLSVFSYLARAKLSLHLLTTTAAVT